MQVYNTSATMTLQQFITCRGLPVKLVQAKNNRRVPFRSELKLGRRGDNMTIYWSNKNGPQKCTALQWKLYIKRWSEINFGQMVNLRSRTRARYSLSSTFSGVASGLHWTLSGSVTSMDNFTISLSPFRDTSNIYKTQKMYLSTQLPSCLIWSNILLWMPISGSLCIQNPLDN